ncbi:ImmA/IrrE family metallo-endopeptidase [Acetobacter sp. A11-2]|uniref:ImmA/IrrE family metallo-endopeptidase n=1 Tax=Acetobacter sp. A11-2 TaxID=3157859 RepID=UPI0032ECC270
MMCATREQFVSPLPIGASKVAVEQFAADVARKLHFNIDDNIMRLVARLGGKIVTGTTGPEDEESGSLIAASLNEFTIFLSPLTSSERDRFTIAHELGHLLMHLPVVKKRNSKAIMRATRYVDERSPQQQRAEWEANWFAAALLMPADIFKAEMLFGFSHLKARFQVSGAAINARAKSLGVNL